MENYEKAKEEAFLKSQGAASVGIAGVNLDVHDIASLQEKGTPLTDDSLKYEYKYSNKKRTYGNSHVCHLFSLTSFPDF